MLENLKVTRYADGTPIPHITDGFEWVAAGASDTGNAYCWYDNDSVRYARKYGALYNYVAATNGNFSGNNVQGACPNGWHLPNNDEWTALINYISSNGYFGVEGTALKASTDWNNNGNGNDVYGFAAVPGGYHDFAYIYCNGMGVISKLWSSTRNDEDDPYCLSITYNSPSVSINTEFNGSGFSIRCIKN